MKRVPAANLGGDGDFFIFCPKTSKIQSHFRPRSSIAWSKVVKFAPFLSRKPANALLYLLPSLAHIPHQSAKMSGDKMEVEMAEEKLKTMEHSEQHYFKR